jgi:hypothetical protein
MKQIIKLTESDLHRIIKESVNKIIKECGIDPYSLDADEIYGDKASREDAFNQKMQMMDDDWKIRNIRLRKKYPGKSEEWYEAMIDTFYENKKARAALKEDGGATNCAGAMQTGSGNAPLGSNPEAGQYTVPFGKVQRRKIYQPKDKSAGGDVTKQSSNVDMTPAMNRKDGKGGSISIPKNRK